MPSTVEQQIEKMLADTVKGLASKAELKTAVAETVKTFFEEQDFLAQFQTAQKSIDDLQAANDDLVTQIKALRRNNYAALKASDGSYKGVWGSPQMAEAFGLFVLGDIKGIKSCREKFDRDYGFERKCLTDDGSIKALGGDVNTTGGALVPTEFIPNLINLIEDFGTFRQVALRYPVGSDTAVVPVQTSDVTVSCPAAGVTVTASNPGFKNIGVMPKKWMTLTAIDSELNEDAAVAVGEIVAESIARAFATQEDKCGFVGDGTSTYFNTIGARAALRAVDATVTNVKGLHVQDTAGAWSSIDLQDLLAVCGLLLPSFDNQDATWVCSKMFYLTVMVNAALAAGGTYGKEVELTAYGQGDTYFLGRRVALTSAMPLVKPATDHCPLLFGNFRKGSILADRRVVTIDQSREAYFTTDQIGIRGTQRIDIVNHGVGNTDNAGPIVGLWADIS